jgi:RNA polymerase sigma-70 factor (ECF subfamily)
LGVIFQPQCGRNLSQGISVDERPDAEAVAFAHLEEGATSAAAEVVLRAYGPELLAYLRRFARSPELAEEAFSRLCEGVVRDIAGFTRGSSLRTWVYAVARNALAAERRAENRRRAKATVLEGIDLEALVADVRERTATFLRTEARQRFEQARGALAPEDEELLVLRLSRRMSWLEIAKVFGAPTQEERKLAATLRKRYERLKLQMRAAVVSTDEDLSHTSPGHRPAKGPAGDT